MPPQPDGPVRRDRVVRYRPRVPQRIPQGILDERFDEIFAKLPSDRDQALVAFWISSGVRASEFLAGVEAKLAQLDAQAAQAQRAVDLGIPSFGEIAARTT